MLWSTWVSCLFAEGSNASTSYGAPWLQSASNSAHALKPSLATCDHEHVVWVPCDYTSPLFQCQKTGINWVVGSDGLGSFGQLWFCPNLPICLYLRQAVTFKLETPQAVTTQRSPSPRWADMGVEDPWLWWSSGPLFEVAEVEPVQPRFLWKNRGMGKTWQNAFVNMSWALLEIFHMEIHIVKYVCVSVLHPDIDRYNINLAANGWSSLQLDDQQCWYAGWRVRMLSMSWKVVSCFKAV